ncbi:hypothetical protein FQN54_007586 [Arachnomyces sp. PD_36]|nr:hypothetical protein FQN54_007586 [Arachnomyces sp. PD_36]
MISNTSLRELHQEDVKEEILKPPPDAEKLVVSTDHIGVRNIQFLKRGFDALSDGSDWYEIIEGFEMTGDRCLRFSRTALFLQKVRLRLLSDSNSESDSDNHFPPKLPVRNISHWSAPNPPNIKPCNMDSRRPSVLSRLSRLHYVPVQPSTQGPVARRSYTVNMGIYPFKGISTDYTKFVRKMNANREYDLYWMYFPLHTGEKIRYFWTRKSHHYYGGESGPVIAVSEIRTLWTVPILRTKHNNPQPQQLETTRNRTITFGTYAPAHFLPNLDFKLILKDGDGDLSGIIHDGYDPNNEYMTDIGIATTRHVHPKLTDILNPLPENGLQTALQPHSQRDRDRVPTLDTYAAPSVHLRASAAQGATFWHLTKAPLPNLHHIQSCRDTSQPHKPYIGMLLTYTDNSQECLGQFRWDMEISNKIEVPVWVRVGTLGHNWEALSHPRFSENRYIRNVRWGKGEGEGWNEIPSKGTLLWWFGEFGDSIEVVDKEE